MVQVTLQCEKCYLEKHSKFEQYCTLSLYNLDLKLLPAGMGALSISQCKATFNVSNASLKNHFFALSHSFLVYILPLQLLSPWLGALLIYGAKHSSKRGTRARKIQNISHISLFPCIFYLQLLPAGLGGLQIYGAKHPSMQAIPARKTY